MLQAADRGAWFGSQGRYGTIQERMEGPDARKNAFDTIRLFAALTVIVSHSFMVSTGSNKAEPIYWLSSGQTTMGGISVAVFFVISGLFISASFERSKTVTDFTIKRALRIMPAFIVVCALSALIMGPLITTLPVSDYLTRAATWGYFRNVVFLPNDYMLPGVFESHPERAVNGSIWTLKFEVLCYAAAAVALTFGRFRKQVVLAGWIGSFLLVAFWSENNPGGVEYYLLTTARMFRYFGAGMLMYLYRDRIALNPVVALAMLVMASVAITTPYFMECLALLASYPIIVFGYLAPGWFRQITARGDISYGAYIYGWPLQQLVWPIGLGSSMHWLINSAIAVPLAIAFGLLSWRLIEKPALQAKPRKLVG